MPCVKMEEVEREREREEETENEKSSGYIGGVGKQTLMEDIARGGEIEEEKTRGGNIYDDGRRRR